MKYLDEFRDPAAAEALLGQLRAAVTRPWRIMEVCGGQTHAILQFGLDRLIPADLTLLHGPGCPVCVTPVGLIDRAVALAEEHALPNYGAVGLIGRQMSAEPADRQPDVITAQWRQCQAAGEHWGDVPFLVALAETHLAQGDLGNDFLETLWELSRRASHTQVGINDLNICRLPAQLDCPLVQGVLQA